MARTSAHSPPVTSIEFPDELPERLDGEQTEPAGSAIDLALRSTEAALGHVTKLVMENIRRGGDVPPHVEAAERDLRNALRQLGVARRDRHKPL